MNKSFKNIKYNFIINHFNCIILSILSILPKKYRKF